MKIVINHNEPGPVGWLRAWQLGRAMKKRGHTVWMRPDVSEQITKANVDEVTHDADVVICGRTHDMETFVLLLAARSLYHFKLIVDTDDNTDEVPKYAHSFEDWHPGSFLRRMIRGQYKEADLVTVSTPALADVVRPFAKQVVVVPNCVESEWYGGVRFRDKEPRHHDTRIYWGGGANHYDDLLKVKDTLLRICAERPDVKLVFSNFLPDWAVAALPAHRCYMIKVAPFDLYPSVLAWLCADIAIAPLVDNPFNRSKSHIKYLDYAMARIPGVYEALPPYDSVTDGLTGLKASTSDEWYAKLTLLLDTPTLRDGIKHQAYRDVQERWLIDSHATRYESMLRELACPQPPMQLVQLEEGKPLEIACQPM